MSRSDQSPPSDHAVVLGASMAGLLAARVLSEHFGRVTVVDRDHLTDTVAPRRGVPQGRHVHGLLGGGGLILAELFPGFLQRAAAAGAVVGDVLGDARWFLSGRRLHRAHAGVPGIAASRPLLEALVRREVVARARVELLDQVTVTGLEITAGRVVGVSVLSRDGGRRRLTADLVVDATGRGSRTPTWLADAGYPAPATDRIEVGVSYVSRIYRLPPGALAGDHGMVVAATPDNPRGGILASMEGGRHILTLTGVGGEVPPTDPLGFDQFLHALPVTDVAQAVEGGEPMSDPVLMRFPAEVRHRYEDLSRFPAGLLVIGDAVCSFNPVYGQGMTSAARQAMVLRSRLAAGRMHHAGYFRALAAAIDLPWTMAVAGDLDFPGVTGPRTPAIRVAAATTPSLLAAAEADPVVARAFIRVMSLVDPPITLLRPDLLLRAVRGVRVRSGNVEAAQVGVAS